MRYPDWHRGPYELEILRSTVKEIVLDGDCWNFLCGKPLKNIHVLESLDTQYDYTNPFSFKNKLQLALDPTDKENKSVFGLLQLLHANEYPTRDFFDVHLCADKKYLFSRGYISGDYRESYNCHVINFSFAHFAWGLYDQTKRL